MSNNQKEFEKHLLEIMTKFKNGQATDAEIEEINLWYENQASNEGYTDGMSSAKRAETKQKILFRIYDRVHHTSAPVAKIDIYKKIKIFTLAASIFLAIGVALYFQFGQQKQYLKDSVAIHDVVPGQNKAVLILANGKKISLEGLSEGQIASQTGIRISKTANGQLVYEATESTASAALKPEFNTIEVPVGGQWQVILPDHSKVWLNALSRITYPLHFTGNERDVKISGEAYFEVAHNAQMPFKVQAGNQVVEVLGTHFNIMAYADEKLIRTTLIEGSVKVSQGKATKLLVPGEQAQVGKEGIAVTNEVDVEDVVAWKNGYFKFDENLEAIMAKVAKWYNVEVVYQFKPDPNSIYEGKISRSKNISSLLKIIEFNGDVHFKIEGRRVIVTK
nr:FecR family protein [Pedobacter sp. ASV19]